MDLILIAAVLLLSVLITSKIEVYEAPRLYSTRPKAIIHLAVSMASATLILMSLLIFARNFAIRAPSPLDTRAPGEMACGIASAVMLIQAALFFQFAMLRRFQIPLGPNLWGFFHDRSTIVTIGILIASSWLVAVARRRWLPAPDWAERIGRLIGAAWILASAFIAMSSALERSLPCGGWPPKGRPFEFARQHSSAIECGAGGRFAMAKFRLARIEPPGWTMQPDLGIDCGVTVDEYEAIQQHRGKLLRVAHQEVEAYLNDPELAFDDDEGMFPDRR